MVTSATCYMKSETETLDYRLTFTPMTFVYSARNRRRHRNATNPLLMNILSWNVREAAGADFRIIFRELVASHIPNLVILIETHISGDRASRIPGFRKIYQGECDGFCRRNLGTLEPEHCDHSTDGYLIP